MIFIHLEDTMDYNSDNDPHDYSWEPEMDDLIDEILREEEDLEELALLRCEEELDPLQIQVDPMVVLQP